MEVKNLYGLIGYPLSHSFSKRYFGEKFQQEGIPNTFYDLFPLEKIEDLPALLAAHPNFRGLNVTIPYKQAVLPYLDEIDAVAEAVGAVNTIRIRNGVKKGYNTDVYGFSTSLHRLLTANNQAAPAALILGTGGAAQAIRYVLTQSHIPYLSVSRSSDRGDLTYGNLRETHLQSHPLIINTTPLGMAPNIDSAPAIPYEKLNAKNTLFDLVYNPEKTLFLKGGNQAGSLTFNGLEMLHLQAEEAWRIWNND